MSDATLSLSNIYIDYQGTDVVFDVSFDVSKGEVFGLIGLNGVGKTTLIKAILGLHEERTGNISLFGQGNGSMQAREDLVYLPERFEPPWFLTGLEFVKFSLSLYSKAFDKERVFDMANALALDVKALNRKVHSYSKGMRQKLGIIATILTGCRLVILDEPMSGLDPLARSLVKDLIMDLKAEDQTIMICSHILADLDEMCGRIAVMHDGRIDFCDKPAQLKDLTGQTSLERAFLSYVQDKKAA